MSSEAVESLREADFIGADAPRSAATRFFCETELQQERGHIRTAALYATAHGVYEAAVDGRPVSASVLNPGWTSYEWRLNVQREDVTALLVGPDPSGATATGSGSSGSGSRVRLELLLGNGWYRGDLGFGGAKASYGEQVCVCAALSITYDDGSVQRILTSPDWSAVASEVTFNSLYNGETIDARMRQRSAPELPVYSVPVDRETLVEQVSPPITRHEVLGPQKTWRSPSGVLLADFGQNLVGWTRLRVTGESGHRVTIRHAEVLEAGELGTRPLREAKATDTFILSGGPDVFEPTFTFHGFRYVAVEGLSPDLVMDGLEAVVVHSAMRRTGHFECSNPLVNQLVHNSVWGQKGNFLGVPTDCPQRDERLGWTGDIAAFAASASFQFDTSAFLGSWLRDLREETLHSSKRVVPYVVPDVMKHATSTIDLSDADIGALAVWGDAAAWVPEALWNSYGDREELDKQYPAIVMHLESIEKVLSPRGLWESGFQFGDWLDPDAPPDDPAAAKASSGVVATACLYRTARFASLAASVLHREGDARRWADLSGRVRASFNEHYVHDGIVLSDCATVYALAIHFGLLDAEDREAAGRRLAGLVRENGYRITTGFAGTPFVTWALTETGHLEDAYSLLLEEQCPSWLYPVTMGATTIWERWDSMLPDGSINPGEMTSFNHYALGAVVDWIYQVVGGIRPGAPGYSRVRIEPKPGPGIEWAKTSYDSEAGPIETSWKVVDGRLALEVVLPEGVPGDVALPDGSIHHVDAGRHEFEVSL